MFYFGPQTEMELKAKADGTRIGDTGLCMELAGISSAPVWLPVFLTHGHG